VERSALPKKSHPGAPFRPFLLEAGVDFCYLCGSSNLVLLQKIDKKPKQETDFGIAAGSYSRSIYKCTSCSIYNNFHRHNLENLYAGTYNEATYASQVLEQYDKIMTLPDEESDNKQRVSRIIRYFKESGRELAGLKVLDVGSGLCVFLGEMMKHGIHAHCIDPDRISIDHALKNVRVISAIEGHFENYPTDQNFDLICFNKVLEHVLNPIELMQKARSLLTEKGLIYIELPDGRNASENGGYIDREEFYIEHYMAFDKDSVQWLIENAGLNCGEANAIHEPSDKYTLYAFTNQVLR
jgi:SAM-dependent methyltransferase